ncbi:MAG: HepT-like ribonuclease domain-containing protein [Hyphomicrobium sp.]
MAKPTAPERLQHILTAIQDIEMHTSGLTLADFRADRFRRMGVERCLEIISEASRHIPQTLKDLHPEIPWVRVADIGNRIRHAYHAVDSEIV